MIIKKSAPPIVDTAANLTSGPNSSKLIPDGRLAKSASSPDFKVGIGSKKFDDLESVKPTVIRTYTATVSSASSQALKIFDVDSANYGKSYAHFLLTVTYGTTKQRAEIKVFNQYPTVYINGDVGPSFTPSIRGVAATNTSIYLCLNANTTYTIDLQVIEMIYVTPVKNGVIVPSNNVHLYNTPGSFLPQGRYTSNVPQSYSNYNDYSSVNEKRLYEVKQEIIDQYRSTKLDNISLENSLENGWYHLGVINPSAGSQELKFTFFFTNGHCEYGTQRSVSVRLLANIIENIEYSSPNSADLQIQILDMQHDNVLSDTRVKSICISNNGSNLTDIFLLLGEPTRGNKEIYNLNKMFIQYEQNYISLYTDFQYVGYPNFGNYKILNFDTQTYVYKEQLDSISSEVSVHNDNTDIHIDFELKEKINNITAHYNAVVLVDIVDGNVVWNEDGHGNYIYAATPSGGSVLIPFPKLDI